MFHAFGAGMLAPRLLAILSVGAFLACGGASETVPPAGGSSSGQTTTTPETPEVTNQEGAKVRAKIAAASLGGGFGGSANVQLAFVSEAAAPASIVVVKVDLVDTRDNKTVDTLDASAPSVWNGSTYESWNEQVTPGGDLRASYQLTTPDWSTIDKSAKVSGTSSYSTPFKLVMIVRIDGAEVTLLSETLQREPEVAT